jgi:ubiquinone/menaquinone biosynthesis C-methylase UbiE
MAADGVIADGVVICPACGAWYPVEDELLELLPEGLAYHDDRRRFQDRHGAQLAALNLKLTDPEAAPAADYALQKIQQDHFDWYANNDEQTYSEYEQTPFWRAADRLAFERWREQIAPDSWLLEVGCAQGRATFNFTDQPIHIMGFDISKALVRQAITRARAGTRAKTFFFVGDGHNLPLVDASVDVVLIYGVLHHLPDPGRTCAEVARVLKPGGVYLGSENNQTVFRGIFELLQRLNPLWHEEAGPQALISARNLHRWFGESGHTAGLTTRTSVFLPPHLFSLLSNGMAYRLLRWTDRAAGIVPGLRGNGGLILVEMRKGSELIR